MTEPTQTELRTWARAQGMTVKDRGSLPLAVRQAYLEARDGAPAVEPAQEPAEALSETPAGSVTAAEATDEPADLAAGLRTYLSSVDAEVRAVSTLSERIDAHVAELNALREEQAVRLLALDELQESVSDPSLSAFLATTIRPRPVRVAELIPERLR